MKCPTCGAENDPANRFCDQCGTRLDQPAAQSQEQAEQTMVAQPASVATVCPNCGAPVLPGEAFCDNCGSALTGPAPDTSSVAPAPAATTAASGLTCPACGSPVAPGDAFCDNCGASLASAPTAMTESAPVAAPLPDTTSTAESGAAPVDATTAPAAPGDGEAPAGAEAQAAPTGDAASGEPTAIPVTVETATAPSDATSSTATPDTSTAPDTATAAPDTSVVPVAASVDGDAQAAYEAARQQLDDEITRQQGIITQLEGVQSMLGAGTPAGVLQSLDEARAALAKAQVERDTLQAPAPAVDPAEVARLNDEISRQQGVVTQLEGVQSMLGAGTPAGVLQSLDEARAALAKAQSDLQALGGETSGTAQSQPATPTPAATTAAPQPAAPSEPAAATTATAAPEAAAAPAPAGPRLTVDESGVDIALPADKSEYVIGREDPISGIFPEVDLTPYGGENGGVSRQHARLSRSGSQWMLTDLNSTNHTRVDGARLEPNTPTEVKDGSKLQFGRLALTFHA